MILVVSRGAALQPRSMQIRRVIVHFQVGIVPAGERKGVQGLFALLDPDTPGVEEALGQIRAMPKQFDVVGDVEAPKASPVRAVAGAPVERDAVPPLVRQVFRQGWTLEDMAGAGKGDKWDREGGVSAVAGLSVAEMAMSFPPTDWRKRASTMWPWEDPSWKAPSPSWAPPGMPGKVIKPRVEAIPEPPQEPFVEASSDVATFETSPVVVDPATIETATLAKVVPVADSMDAIISNAVAVASPEVRTALGEYGTPEQVIQAIAVLMGLSANGPSPSEQKYNYHVQKRGLPRAKKAALEAFNTILSSIE